MLASLYRRMIRLHPRAFRERFGDEMLSIFGQAQGTAATVSLLLDALASLTRQWILRSDFWHKLDPVPTAVAQSDVPTFSSLDPFRPSYHAVIEGLLLSITLFCLTCFAIRYSWIRVLHIRIPEVQFERPTWRPQATALPSRETFETPAPAPQPKPSRTPANTTSASAVAAQPLPVQQPHRKRIPGAATLKRSRPAEVSTAPNEVSQLGLETALSPALFAGTYVVESPRKLTIVVTSSDGSLAMRMAGQPRLALIPATPTKFAVAGMADCWIDFLPENDSAQGTPMLQLKLSCNGEQLIAHRQ